MLTVFSDSPVLDCDCYVADYTDQTDNAKGVEISLEPFSDITYFHLKKQGQGQMPYQAVNLERYPSFISGIDNCECVFNSLSQSKRTWVLFLETKYVHKPENIDRYPVKAYGQMKETLGKLVASGEIIPDERRIYFVYSVPPFPEEAPFGAFAISQNDSLRAMEENGIKLFGYNTILIGTPQHLFVPTKPV